MPLWNTCVLMVIAPCLYFRTITPSGQFLPDIFMDCAQVYRRATGVCGAAMSIGKVIYSHVDMASCYKLYVLGHNL